MLIHLILAIGFMLAGFSEVGLIFGLIAGYIGMIITFITYHRYLAHQAFKTSRLFQFILAFISCSMVHGVPPLWWASIHRHHHRHSDTEKDLHTPKDGLWHSHISWTEGFDGSHHDTSNVRSLMKCPELNWLNGPSDKIKRNYYPPLVNLSLVLILGSLAMEFYPEWELTFFKIIMWGYFFRAMVTYHALSLSASLCHTFGKKPYDTKDRSTNSIILALLTGGEGWHNNHHRYQMSARCGFLWYQIDINYYVIKILEKLGLVWDLKEVPSHVIEEGYSTSSIASKNL